MTMTDILLAVDKLKIRVGANGPLAVNDLSFTIAPGEIVALVGESGSGKTMAARAAIGLLPPPLAQCSGQVRFQGHDLGSLAPEHCASCAGRRSAWCSRNPWCPSTRP